VRPKNGVAPSRREKKFLTHRGREEDLTQSKYAVMLVNNGVPQLEKKGATANPKRLARRPTTGGRVIQRGEEAIKPLLNLQVAEGAEEVSWLRKQMKATSKSPPHRGLRFAQSIIVVSKKEATAAQRRWRGGAKRGCGGGVSENNGETQRSSQHFSRRFPTTRERPATIGGKSAAE